LTAIRAELKQNREQLYKENKKTGNALKLPVSIEKKNPKQQSNKIRNKFETVIKNTKLFTHFIDTETKVTNDYTESHKRSETVVHKLNTLKVLANYVFNTILGSLNNYCYDSWLIMCHK
jgi:hypothetical protein